MTSALALCWNRPIFAATIARFSHVCQLVATCFTASWSATWAAANLPRRMLSAATLFQAWPFSASICVHRTNAERASSSRSAFKRAYPALNQPSGKSGLIFIAADQCSAALVQSSRNAARLARDRMARAFLPSETSSAFWKCSSRSSASPRAHHSFGSVGSTSRRLRMVSAAACFLPSSVRHTMSESQSSISSNSSSAAPTMPSDTRCSPSSLRNMAPGGNHAEYAYRILAAADGDGASRLLTRSSITSNARSRVLARSRSCLHASTAAAARSTGRDRACV